MDMIRRLLAKYHEEWTYIFFGGLTTVLYTLCYGLLTRVMGLGEVASSVLSSCVSILFAYVTNKIWVFRSRGIRGVALAKEFVEFISARLLSMALNALIVHIGVERLGIYDMYVMLFGQVFVILFNYAASKLFIFRKGGGK